MDKINPKDPFMIHPDVMYSFIDHEAIMLKCEEDGLFGLNEIATVILKQLQLAPSSLRDLTKHVSLYYEVDQAQCYQDLHDFLVVLLENQLITLQVL